MDKEVEKFLQDNKLSLIVKVHRDHERAAKILDSDGNWHESAIEMSAYPDETYRPYEYYVFKFPPVTNKIISKMEFKREVEGNSVTLVTIDMLEKIENRLKNLEEKIAGYEDCICSEETVLSPAIMGMAEGELKEIKNKSDEAFDIRAEMDRKLTSL